MARPTRASCRTQRAPLPAAWDFAHGAAARGAGARQLLRRLGRHAQLITWPEQDLSLAITADPLFGHLVIYIPPGQDFFCVEPVSHVNDGFNLAERGVADTGVRVLAPGESLRGAVRFAVGRRERAGRS